MAEGQPLITERPIRVLLVGYGAMGKGCHSKVLANSRDVVICGVVRRQLDLPANAPTFTSLTRAIEATSPHMVVISTPHYLHAEQCAISLHSGAHVFVDKPLALTSQDVIDLVQLARSKELLLVVGLQRRYEGLASVFREFSSAGHLGHIRLVHGLFAHRFENGPDANWRRDIAFAGMGVIDDSAIHLIDLLVLFGGTGCAELQSIVQRQGAFVNSLSCHFRTSSGAMSSGTCSYSSPVNSVQEEISIFGTKGALFGRRFCREWSPDPPIAYFKSADGSRSMDIDLHQRPYGRELPLMRTLSVLKGEMPRETLLSEARDVLDSHMILCALRRNAEHDPQTV